MLDFPPAVPDLAPRTPVHSAAEASRARTYVETGGRGRREPFTDPDTRSPNRFMRWMLRQQTSNLAAASVCAVIEFMPGSIGPWVVGRLVDRGIRAFDMENVLLYAVLLLGMILVGVSAGVLRHTLIVRTWLVAMYGVIKLVARKTTQMGHVQVQRTPTGEILSISGGDSDQFGAVTEVATRAIGNAVAFALVATIVLRTSVPLGVVVLIAAPALLLLAAPLLKPLQRRQEIERNRASELTSLATDIVAGLRILRGIGGERTFAQNYATQSQRTRKAGVAAGVWQAAVDSAGVLFAGLFLVLLAWLGAREVAYGRLSVGQLISFFGYAVFMVWPIRTFFELVQKWVRGLVSAQKTIAVLGQQPPWHAPTEPKHLPHGAEIRDEVSGFVARPGELTVVVSALPDDSAALADRLGRYLPADHEPVSIGIDDDVKGRARRRAKEERRKARLAREARDAEMAAQTWKVTVGGIDLAEVAMSEIRERILVSDTASLVFAGTLQTAIDPHSRLALAEAEKVLYTAAAEDVFEAMPGGWQGRIDERGRGLSGGQRQRVVLARALAMDPEILILVEPTSAVDAHTEAMIASRLAEHRRGQTTIVTSVSPLILHHADRVVLLRDGHAIASGQHEQLLAENADYRHVVARALDDDVDLEHVDLENDDHQEVSDHA